MATCDFIVASKKNGRLVTPNTTLKNLYTTIFFLFLKYFPPTKISKDLYPDQLLCLRTPVCYQTTSPIRNLCKMSKIRGRRQGPECKQSFKEELLPIFDDALNTIRVFVVSHSFLIMA